MGGDGEVMVVVAVVVVDGKRWVLVVVGILIERAVPSNRELYLVMSLASSRRVMTKEKVFKVVGENSLISDANWNGVDGIL